ncbi:hypothetical protein [Streptomyces sp. t39]|uniref:hypothetical protein n=1 Tax=Streptomyces sp. t39 TaxID=1828156 RepID=UPI0011CE9EE3|nr:hypothetical protein [Streptomyces sp. t39]TXS35243.1 hypothetical protein EAO77_37345 [Streptomyces sp. t39]
MSAPDPRPAARVYGSEPGDPDPGPRPGCDYAELIGGPLDGLLLDVTGWTEDDRATGAALITPHGQYGPGGRAHYEPRHPADLDRFHWTGDTP